MRLVHTSDWHAGRQWRGVDRAQELQAVLDQLGEYLVKGQIDVLLHSGNLFGGPRPDGVATQRILGWLRQVADAGIKIVAIAGDHDDPAQLEALATLAGDARLHLLGTPKPPEDGGVRRIPLTNGEILHIGCLPFADPVFWENCLGEPYEHDYPKVWTRAWERTLAVLEQAEAGPKVVMAHVGWAGARLSASEKLGHQGPGWTVSPRVPAWLSYVALGHRHCPQSLSDKIYYAGAPYSLEFGENDAGRGFLVVDTEIQRIPYRGTRPFLDWRGTFDELLAEAEALSGAGWLRVTLETAKNEPDLMTKVRDLVGAVVVRVENTGPGRPPPWVGGGTPAERYAHFLARRQLRLEPGLMEAFEALYAAAVEDR